MEYLAGLDPEGMAPGPELEAVEGARKLRAEAAEASAAMRRLMEDQLEACRYSEAAGNAISQGVILGTGVLKGPFSTWRKNPYWRRAPEDGEGWTVDWREGRDPAFHWVDTWNFYPDMDCSSVDDMEYAYELRRMTRRQLRMLARRDDFETDAIDYLLARERGLASEKSVEFGNFTRYLKGIEGQGIDVSPVPLRDLRVPRPGTGPDAGGDLPQGGQRAAARCHGPRRTRVVGREHLVLREPDTQVRTEPARNRGTAVLRVPVGRVDGRVLHAGAAGEDAGRAGGAELRVAPAHEQRGAQRRALLHSGPARGPSDERGTSISRPARLSSASIRPITRLSNRCRSRATRPRYWPSSTKRRT